MAVVFVLVLAGIITWGDIVRTLAEEGAEEKAVLEAGNDQPIVTYPDELLYDAVAKMLRNDIGRLPVVDRKDPGHLVGYLGRSAVMEARMLRLREEHVREPGWLENVTFPRRPKARAIPHNGSHPDAAPEEEPAKEH